MKLQEFKEYKDRKSRYDVGLLVFRFFRAADFNVDAKNTEF